MLHLIVLFIDASHILIVGCCMETSPHVQNVLHSGADLLHPLALELSLLGVTPLVKVLEVHRYLCLVELKH